jgi:twitching motility protein PilT
MSIDVKSLLQTTVDLNASDLHLVVGVPPTVRINGELRTIPQAGILTPDIISEGLKGILTSEQLERLTVNKEIDFSLSFSEKARFRVNAYTQKNSLAAAFRKIPLEIPDLDRLELPKIVRTFTNLRQGLILVTGPTGHGKSTTLAAIINEINKKLTSAGVFTRKCHSD